MTTDPTQRPYGDAEPEHGSGGSPHLSDYWQIISRRLWLVLVIFAVTAASSIWAVSRRRIYYQGSMTLQVNDPLERQRGLVAGSRVSGMDIFVDPIQSEIQVLRSSTIARTVADSVGLRFRRVPSTELRSKLARDIWVAPNAPDGRYQLVYDASGSSAQLRTMSGTVVGTGAVGKELDGGFVRFRLQPPPGESHAYPVAIVPLTAVQGEVSFSTSTRENTNIIDVSFVYPDPVLLPRILNEAGEALREKGAERVRASAEKNIEFINQMLDSAHAELTKSMDAIRDFKKTQAFNNLSDQERALVNRSQGLNQETADWDAQRQALSALVDTIGKVGVDAADLAAAQAQLSPDSNSDVIATIQSIQAKQAEKRHLINEERKSPAHPEVMAVTAEITQLGKQLVSQARASLGVVDKKLQSLAAQEQVVRQQQKKFPALEGKLEALKAQQATDQNQYQFLLSQLYQAQITRAAAEPYVDILDPSTGAWQVQGKGKVNVVLGALLGLILGVGAAFFLEYLDRTVRTSADVESLLGIPVLGIIPRLRSLSEKVGDAPPAAGPGRPLMVAMDPLDPAAEAYRNLRMNLMFMSTEEDPVRTVLFSSPGSSEGKSTTAINFAVMLAQQGQRVLVIDADLRRPSLHRALDVLREPGLTNLLVGNAETREAVRPNVLPSLDFLPSGPFPPNPSELLNSKAMVRILEEFEGRYDQIVIDSPPVLAVTDAAVLAVHVDGVVLVLRSGETEQRSAERSVEQLRRLGVRVFGAVLNEVSAGNPDESYYLEYYYTSQPTAARSGWKRLREGLSKVRFFS